MEKTFPAFPALAQPAILRIWQEAHDRPTAGEVSMKATRRHVTNHNKKTNSSGKPKHSANYSRVCSMINYPTNPGFCVQTCTGSRAYIVVFTLDWAIWLTNIQYAGRIFMGVKLFHPVCNHQWFAFITMSKQKAVTITHTMLTIKTIMPSILVLRCMNKIPICLLARRLPGWLLVYFDP